MALLGTDGSDHPRILPLVTMMHHTIAFPSFCIAVPLPPVNALFPFDDCIEQGSFAGMALPIRLTVSHEINLALMSPSDFFYHMRLPYVFGFAFCLLVFTSRQW